MTKTIDQFHLSNVAPERVARAAFTVIDQLQVFPKEVQSVGIAAALLILCEAVGVENPQELFVVTKNLLNDEREGGRDHFVAVRQYVSNEIAKLA